MGGVFAIVRVSTRPSFLSRQRSINLSAPLLLEGYRRGLFPMALEDGEIGWFSPDPRGIIPIEPGKFHIPHGLRRRLKHNPFAVTIDQDFEGVIRACAERRETWISEEIIRSYQDLHMLGYAHSVECRMFGELVGGLYGVALRGVFFGESMFHTATDASKIALVAHGGVMDCLYRAATRVDLQAPRSWSLANAAINRLLYTAEGFTLVGWNDTRHLDGTGPLDERNDRVGQIV